jgi:hypothetical protein
LSVERFDKNVLGQFRAEPETGVANQANQIGVTAEQLDALLFAKAQFAESNGDFRRALEPPDADGCASDDPAQRTNERVGTPFICARCHWFVHRN